MPVFTSGTLVFVAAQEVTFDDWVLATSGACLPGSCGNVTIGETAGFPHRAPNRQQMKHTLSISVVETWSLGLRGQTSDVAHIHRPEMLLGNIGWGMPSLRSPWASLRLTQISQEGENTLISSPKFCSCCPDHLAVEANRVYNRSPTGMFTFAYFKSCCLRVWPPISLNFGAD